MAYVFDNNPLDNENNKRVLPSKEIDEEGITQQKKEGKTMADDSMLGTAALMNGGLGGASMIVIILVLLFAFGGWGRGFGGGQPAFAQNIATSSEVQRGFDNQNSMSNQREILSGITAGVSNLAQITADKYNEITRDIGGVSSALQQAIANQNSCCGELKLLVQGVNSATNANIAQSRYDAALNTAAINATTTAQTQKILDALANNKIEALQGQVNSLQLQNAVAGVVRYPNATTYNAGMSPFCGGCYNGYVG